MIHKSKRWLEQYLLQNAKFKLYKVYTQDESVRSDAIRCAPFILSKDGQGGYFQAVGAFRFPTANGLGQLVFFFHNEKVVGLNSNVEVAEIRSIQAAGTGEFVITYAIYRPTDIMMNPTLSPI